MANPDYVTYIRNANRIVVDELHMWNSFTTVSRFNGIGTFELSVPKGLFHTSLLIPGSGLVCTYKGTPYFSATISHNYEETSEEIIMSGEDDNTYLRTPARPTPTLAEPPYTHEYDTETGVASSLLRSLVARNIGPGAPAAWRMPGLVIGADPLLGGTLTSRARFDPLIVLLRELAITGIAGGLGFRILQKSIYSTDLTFEVYQPRDQSEKAVFGVEFGTAKDYRHTRSMSGANYFIVAGGDDFGINRTVIQGGNNDLISIVGYRITEFIDRRGTTDLSELEQDLAEAIAGTGVTNVINVDPIQIKSLDFVDEYNLGDKVTAAVNGVKYPRIVRELECIHDVDAGTRILPMIADPNGSNDDITARQLAAIDHRLSYIEQNYNVPDNSIIPIMLHETIRLYPGDLKLTARAAAQNGWLLCDGSAISRTTYAELFNAIGTTYGAGNGTTTFNIPDFRDRYIMGKGPVHALGTSGGAFSVSIPAHNHNHSHGMNNHTHASQAHTHPGSHSHGRGTLAMAHTHDVDLDHNHAVEVSGFETNFAADLFGRTGAATTATGHKHNVDLVALGTNTRQSQAASNIVWSGSTADDSNAHSATYTGSPGVPSPNSTEPDLASGGASTPSIKMPYQTANVAIFTNVPTI